MAGGGPATRRVWPVVAAGYVTLLAFIALFALYGPALSHERAAPAGTSTEVPENPTRQEPEPAGDEPAHGWTRDASAPAAELPSRVGEDQLGRVRSAARVLKHSHVRGEGDDIVLEFTIHSVFRPGPTRAGLAWDTYRVLQRVAKRQAEFDRLILVGRAFVADSAGLKKLQPIYRAVFTRETVREVRYADVDRWELSGLRELTAEPMQLESPLSDSGWGEHVPDEDVEESRVDEATAT